MMPTDLFPFSEEHRMLAEVARDFAQREIAPIAAAFDESGEFPHETIQKMGELGLMGVEVSEEFGGAGMDTLAYVLGVAEISKVDASHGIIMSVNNSLFCSGIDEFGTLAQKNSVMRAVASGEAVGAFALTEPMSGSDAGNMKTRAVRTGREYILNGRKSWITSAPVARYITVFCMTAPEKKHRGVTAFVIDTERPGFLKGKKEPKLGIRASATCEIVLEDYHCTEDDRLGQEGDGFKIAMAILDSGRIGVAAQALGIAEAAYQASLAYANEREAFGQKIGDFQGIGFKLADMKMRLESARLMVYNAALTKMRAKKGGGRWTNEAAMAKVVASEAATFITHNAVQIHGGMGYSKECPVERFFRDARITEIYEGTNEILRHLLSRSELTGKT